MDASRLTEEVRDCLRRLSPGRALTRMLIPTGGVAPGGSALQALARHLMRGEAYVVYSKERDALLKDKQEAPESDAAANASRDALACARIALATGVGAGTPPRELIRRALSAEEFAQDRRIANPEMAYVAGLHYDWLAALIARDAIKSKLLLPALDQAWAEGFRIARTAYALAALPSELRQQRYVFAGGLVLKIGAVLMAMNFPQGAIAGGSTSRSWADFMNENSRLRGNAAAPSFFVEKNRFPITHNEMTALYVSSFGLLKPIERALYHYMDPSPLRASEPDQYLMAVLYSVAERLAAAPEDPQLSRFQWNWLEGLGIKEPQVRSAMARVR